VAGELWLPNVGPQGGNPRRQRPWQSVEATSRLQSRTWSAGKAGSGKKGCQLNVWIRWISNSSGLGELMKLQKSQVCARVALEAIGRLKSIATTGFLARRFPGSCATRNASQRFRPSFSSLSLSTSISLLYSGKSFSTLSPSLP
jgi:hypothetical protein